MTITRAALHPGRGRETFFCALIVALFAFLLVAGSATRADAQETPCERYAREAVEAQQKNLSRGCGLSGDPWSLNYAGHLAWCNSAPQASIDHEARIRRTALDQCMRCDRYARAAVDAHARNQSNACGYTGDAWSPDFLNHRAWCQSVPQANADAETRLRADALAKCASCDGYARDAVAAHERNGSLGCGFGGDRWSQNFAGHRAWCIGAAQSQIDAERAARNTLLQQCVACEPYAAAAEAAQRKNRDFDCGYTGDAWSDNRSGHLAWCAFQTQAARDAQTRMREHQLGICLNATPAKKASCEAYAQHARAQNAESRSRRCDFSGGGRWHDNHQDHYRWCLAVESRQAVTETIEREKSLVQCRGSAGRPPSDEQCLVSVTLRNDSCLNADGTPSTIWESGTTSVVGCGDSEENAQTRAKAVFEQMLGACLSDGDVPAAGCCTFEEDATRGCLCR